MKVFPLIALLFGTIAAIGSPIAEDGPFGLSWGMSENDLRQQGIELERESAESGFEIFSTTSLALPDLREL